MLLKKLNKLVTFCSLNFFSLSSSKNNLIAFKYVDGYDSLLTLTSKVSNKIKYELSKYNYGNIKSLLKMYHIK